MDARARELGNELTGGAYRPRASQPTEDRWEVERTSGRESRERDDGNSRRSLEADKLFPAKLYSRVEL
eukprot:scaffold141807_cov32-Tisochrysis_lutea.AAC.1